MKIQSTKNLIFAVSSSFLRAVLRIIQIIITARIFTPSEMGQVAFAWYLLGLLPLLTDPGLSTLVIRTKKNLNNEIFVLALIQSILAIFITITALQISFLHLNSVQKNACLLVLGIVIGNGFSIVWRSNIEKEGKFFQLAVLDFFSALIGVTTTIICALNEFGVISIFLGGFASNCINNLFLIFLKKNSIRINFNLNKTNLYECLIFERNFFLKNILRQLFFSLDLLMAICFFNQHDLGIYILPRNLIFEFFLTVAIPLQRVTLSSVAKTVSSKVEIQKVFEWAYFISFSFTIIIILFSSDIVNILFGSDYKESATILEFLAFIPLARLTLVIFESFRDINSSQKTGIFLSFSNSFSLIMLLLIYKDGLKNFIFIILLHSILSFVFLVTYFFARYKIDLYQRIIPATFLNIITIFIHFSLPVNLSLFIQVFAHLLALILGSFYIYRNVNR